MSKPVVESLPMYGRLGLRRASSEAESTLHRRPSCEMAPLGVPAASTTTRAVPPTGDDMVVERLRIAFGVNDTVIRHLFSIGLSLHTTRTMVSDPARIRLDATIGELDVAINELRSLIFDLELGTDGEQAGELRLRSRRVREGPLCSSD